jgi:choline dehydrogenase
LYVPKFSGRLLLTLGAVNPNYITDAQDFSLLTNATMLVRQIASTPAVKSLYSAEILPGSTVQTDNDFHTFVESNYSPVFHPIGTAAMLPRALGGVVDSNLRVYGVEGVRVAGKLFYNRVTNMLASRCIDHRVFSMFSMADASIIPIQLSAHLASTVYGIAEKVCQGSLFTYWNNHQLF